MTPSGNAQPSLYWRAETSAWSRIRVGTFRRCLTAALLLDLDGGHAASRQVIGASLRMAMSPEVQAGAASGLAERLQRPLFKEQATLNLLAARMLHLGAMSELPYRQVGQALEGLPQSEEGAQQGFRPYNLVGAVMASVPEHAGRRTRRVTAQSL